MATQAEIETLYQQHLGRGVDPSGSQFYANKTPAQIAESLVQSQEFRNRQATTPQQVSNGPTLASSVTNPISQTMQQQAVNPALPAGTTLSPTLMTQQAGEQAGVGINPLGAAQTATASTGQAATVTGPTQTAATGYNASLVGNNAAQTGAAQGTVGANSQVQAAQGQVDPRATVQGQMAGLMQQVQDGTATWANGAIRNANSVMNSRGLGNSSMAGSAIANAAMEAATPIAQADAKVHENMGLANLNNRQQAAIINAQAFQQMDLSNLQNTQQSMIINQQARQQALLSDQAADNASKQFNASSQQQNDQFFATMDSQIKQYNAGQQNAMTQYNAGQENAMKQFNAEQTNMRDKFNQEMALQIDQSNVTWRRSINTANTAAINATNATNVQNLLGLSTTAQNNLWQQFRDEADYAFTAGENSLNRQHNVAMAMLEAQARSGMLDQQSKAQFAQVLGSVAGNILTSFITPTAKG
jgi:hypothetical protein